MTDLTMFIETCMLGIETAKFLRGLQQANTKAFEADVQEMYRDWTIELDKSFSEIKRDIGDIDALIEKQFQDRQFRLLMRNFHLEAVREAMSERRRMLAHATAGACVPTFDLGRRARLERTIREIDPDDVRALYGLSLVVGRYDLEGKDYVVTERLRLHIWESLPNKDILIAAGLINLDQRLGFGGVGGACSLTPLGRDLLLLLKTYVADRGASFIVPGRQPLPGDRPESELRALLVKIDGVKLLLSKLAEVKPLGKQYISPASITSESKQKDPFILFNIFTPERRAEFLELKNQFANTELQIKIENGAQDHFRLMLFGRHDILRLIADDCGAIWS